MSKLIVEVCQIDDVQAHPNADRLEICKIKGWSVISGKGQFEVGDKCIYIPYDVILPPELANGPDDDIPGRLNVMKYCAPLPKDSEGNRPPGGRVRAARLRGEKSFGIIMEINSDDPNWDVGTDVADYFGITKWVSPEPCEDGDALAFHPRFPEYTEIEKYANYPGCIEEGEEVVLTEKIHGKNARLGYVLDTNEEGEAEWTFMAGSHTVRRKRDANRIRRVDLKKLKKDGVIETTDLSVGDIIHQGGRNWRIERFKEVGEDDKRILAMITMLNSDGEPASILSEYWMFLERGGFQELLKYLALRHLVKQPWLCTR